MIARVLALLEDSPSAAAALDHALDIADALHLPVTAWCDDESLASRMPTAALARATRYRGGLAAASVADGSRVRYIPAPTPLFVEARAHLGSQDLLAMGCPLAAHRTSVGTVIKALVADPPCSLLVCQSAPVSVRHVLTPFVGGAPAGAALRMADHLSQRLGLPLEVMTMGGRLAAPADLEAEARAILGSKRSKESSLIQVQSSRNIEESTLIQRLSSQDTTALLVLGAGSGSMFVEMFFGPGSGQLSKHLTGPVMLVPA